MKKPKKEPLPLDRETAHFDARQTAIVKRREEAAYRQGRRDGLRDMAETISEAIKAL